MYVYERERERECICERGGPYVEWSWGVVSICGEWVQGLEKGVEVFLFFP